MTVTEIDEWPADALLARYRTRGAFTDGYAVEVPGVVNPADFIEAFYTSALFKVERRILACFVFKPSSDGQARQLALGDRDRFAAWTVEARSANELLMCDFTGRTRSWLMCAASCEAQGSPRTRLYFGTAVVPHRVDAAGRGQLNGLFRALMGFHKAYSRALLRAAADKLAVMGQAPAR